MTFGSIKPYPVYFYVQRKSYFGDLNRPIPFEFEVLNIGNAMDANKGIFTAPKSGVYHFTFDGIGRDRAVVNLSTDDKYVGTAFAPYNYYQNLNTLTLSSTLKLKKGDQIKLLLMEGAISSDDYRIVTHFTGMLVAEDEHE